MNASILTSLPSLIVAILILAALFLLLDRDRSPWLVLAIAAQLASLCLHGLLMIVPEAMSKFRILFAIWPAVGLAFGVGLLGYAIERRTKTTP